MSFFLVLFPSKCHILFEAEKQVCVSDGIGCGYFSVFFLRTGRLLKSVLKVNFGPWMVLVVVTSTWFDFQKVKSEQNVWFVGLRNTTFFMTSNPQSTAIIIIIIIMVVMQRNLSCFHILFLHHRSDAFQILRYVQMGYREENRERERKL